MSETDKRRRNDEPPLFQAALIAFTVLLVLSAAVFGIDWLLRADSFPVRNVRFEGEFRHVTHAELASAVKDVVRRNFLTVDLDAVKEKVEELPWVRTASVRRHWPRDVAVQFTEQHPVARWGAEAWVNDEGRVIKVQADDLPADAPELSGPAGTGSRVLEQFHLLRPRFQSIGQDIQRLTLTARHSWRIELVNGMVLVLDREDPAPKVDRFVRSYSRTLAAVASGVRQVDLRYANGFAVQWSAARMPPAESGTRPLARAGTVNEG
jgi:cell division protein FtsQ